MGAKTKYYTAVDCQRMFDDTDDLYVQEMLRIYAQTKSMDAGTILPAMITDSMFFFNERVFEKMGTSAEVTMTIGSIDMEAVKAYIYSEVDPTVDRVLEWFTTDQNGKRVDSTMLKVKSYLYDTYGKCAGAPVECWQYLNGDMSPEGQYIVEIDITPIDGVCYKVKTEDVGNDRTPVISIKDDGTGIDRQYVTMISEEDGSEIDVEFPFDSRVVYGISYVTIHDELKYIMAFQSDIKTGAENKTCLMVSMKKDEQWVGESDKYKEFVLNRFGVGAEDPHTGDSLEKSLDQEDLRDAFLSYTTQLDDEDFGYIVHEIYGDISAGLGREVTIRGDHTLTYTPGELCNEHNYSTNTCMPPYGAILANCFKCYDTGEMPPDNPDGSCGCCYTYSVQFNREVACLPKLAPEGNDTKYSPMYIVPTEYLQRIGVPDKFRAYQKLFTMWIYFEKEVKISWWQTAFFRFLFFVVSVVFAAVMFGPTALMNIALSQVLSMTLQAIDPRIGAVISLALGFMSGAFNGAMGIVNLVQKLMKMVQSFNLMAFRADLEQIKEDTEHYSEETREMAEWIAEARKPAIWAPLDWTDSFYNMQYQLLYEMPYSEVYNYNNIYDSAFRIYPR